VLTLDEAFMIKMEFDREADGRWIAEVPLLPGILAYGDTIDEARSKAQILTLRVVADRLENGEPLPKEIASAFEAA
jgi:predicted RNase H-like HicB family nuclease